MKYLLAFAFTLVFSIALIGDVSAEPEVFATSVDPPSVDNQEAEDVNFQGDCSVCNEGELEYFYWNSSIDGILNHGDNFTNVNFVISSIQFTTGDHEITLQVKGDGNWSVIDDESTVQLGVACRDGCDDSITVNFDIAPPSLRLGETARFVACTEMQPPQPCVDQQTPDLDFNWTIQWNSAGDWEDLGYQESFEYNNFVEGTHNVSLIIKDNSNGEVSEPGYREIIILPPLPVAVIGGATDITVKEGQPLILTSHCENLYGNLIDCEHSWEIWEAGTNGKLQFKLTGKNITLDNLTNEMQSYDIMLRTTDDQSVLSYWVHVFVTVNPPNQTPSALITISPQSLGGENTPEYYQYADLTFSSSNSSDPDGQIVGYRWWFGGGLVSTDSDWKTSFSEIGVIFQVQLEVQDDNGVWSTKIGSNFKLIENTPPLVNFTVLLGDDGVTFTFNSTVSDAEGSVVAYEWFIDDILNSTDANITWRASQSGSYVVKLIVTDDGGLRSEVNKSVQTETVEIRDPKNFLVSFTSKNIDVGGTFTINFTGTTGEVDFYEVTIYYPDGSNKVHIEYEKCSHSLAECTDTVTYKLDKEGKHIFDIVVRWKDASSYNANTDFYSTKVNVGNVVDDTSPEQPDSPPVDIDEGLPSLSFSGALFSITVLALLRRQR